MHDEKLIDWTDLTAIATFPNVDEAERAGAQLIADGITVRLGGNLRGESTLLVHKKDAEKARGLLDLQQQIEETIEPFHPCPRCATEDPIWYGKRIAILFVTVTAGLLILARFITPVVFLVSLVAGLSACTLIARRIPNFECRRCGYRWSEERKKEPE